MMKKILASLCLALMLTVTAAPAAFAADRVNLLASKSDWSVFEDNNSILTIADRTMSITPTDTDAGATYVSNSYRNAVIEFDYQISYDPEVEPYHEDDSLLPGSFWGILFGNNVTVGSDWQGVNVLPWKATGGYPYMLCFDTERQTTDETSGRYTQVGLTLRRYKEDGGHTYDARWSTVDPGDFEYLTSEARTGLSLTPAFSKPVAVSDCFDTAVHSVKLDYRAEYKSMGAEKDAIVINVWFDGELVLTVVDEMPFESERWGVTTQVDKRDQPGYVAVFAHHASVSSAALYDWKVDISNLYLTDLGAVNSQTGDNNGDSNGGGCNKSSALPAVLLAVGALAAIVGKRG